MADTSIEWTEKTWNPVRGCSVVSAGCTNCYAMRTAHRFSGPGGKYEGLTRARKNLGPVWTGEVRFVPEKLEEPLRWRKPARVFVNSMSDLFHEGVTDEQIAAVFGVMASCPQHTFQVLTKRPERARRWFAWIEEQIEIDGSAWTACLRETVCHFAEPALIERITEDGIARDGAPGAEPWPLPNVWLGVSVEDRKYGVPRIAHLRETPAAVRFLSIEPLLEDIGELDLTGISWCIVGGESGAGARPMQVEWARSIRDQCAAAGVVFFFKQWGGVRKKLLGRELDGRTHDAFPEGARG